MPVIRALPNDPTDLVMQGEQFRAWAFLTSVSSFWSSPVVMAGSNNGLPLTWSYLVADDDEEDTGMMGDGVLPLPLRSQEGDTLVAANALISTPCGALIMVPLGRTCQVRDWVQATNTWAIAGQTLTGAGAALGSCRVMAYETGRLSVTSVPPAQFYSAGNANPATWQSPSPVVAEAISDGSGNFSLPVPMNTAYQLTGYLSGSPDRAGITKTSVVPTDTTTPIYMRDPTVPDSAGSASFRPIGSAVVRRIDH